MDKSKNDEETHKLIIKVVIISILISILVLILYNSYNIILSEYGEIAGNIFGLIVIVILVYVILRIFVQFSNIYDKN